MLALLAGLTTPAHAVLYAGTPILDGYIQQLVPNLTSGTAYLTKMRVFNCDGTYTDYVENLAFDPVVGHSRQIQGGDLCKIRFYWGADMDLKGVNGNGNFELLYTEPYTDVDIDPDVTTPALTPYEVVSGSSVQAPRVFLSID